MENRISITYYDRVFVSLGIQREMSVRRIVICGLSVSTTCFPYFSHKRHDFRKKKKIEHKTLVFIFSTNSK